MNPCCPERFKAQRHGHGLARLGATAEVTHGGLPYSAPQVWSHQIHELFADIDGIAYNARHDDEQLSFAIVERARPRLIESHRELDLARPWFFDLIDKYRVGLAP